MLNVRRIELLQYHRDIIVFSLQTSVKISTES